MSSYFRDKIATHRKPISYERLSYWSCSQSSTMYCW